MDVLESPSRLEERGLISYCGVHPMKKCKRKALVLAEITKHHFVYNIDDYSFEGLSFGTEAVSTDEDLGTRGTVRWMGRKRDGKDPSRNNIMVGLELKDLSSSCTDGCYDGVKVIDTYQRNIIFLKLKKLKPCPKDLWNRGIERQNSAKITGQKEEPQASVREQIQSREMRDLAASGIQVDKLIAIDTELYTLNISSEYLTYNIDDYMVYKLRYGDVVKAGHDIIGDLVWMGRHMSVKASLDMIDVGIKMGAPDTKCTKGTIAKAKVVETDRKDIYFTKLRDLRHGSIQRDRRSSEETLTVDMSKPSVSSKPHSVQKTKAQHEIREIKDLAAIGIRVDKLIDIETELYTLNISSEYLTYNIDDYLVYKLRYGDVVNAGHDIIGELVWMGRRMSVKPSLDEVIVGIKMGVPDKKCTKGTIGKAKVVETDRKDIYFTELRDLRHASIQRDQRSSGTLTVDMSKPSASSKPHSVQKTKEPQFMYDDRKEIRYLEENGVTVLSLVKDKKFIDKQEVYYITFNIRDFSINGLKHGVEAFAEEEEEAGKVVWIGHNQHNDTIYVGIEMEFPNQRCTKGTIGTDIVYPTVKRNILFTELSRCEVHRAPPPRRCGSRKGERKPDKSLDQDEYATDWEVELSRLRDCRVEVENKTDKEAKFCSFFNSYGGDGYITYITYNIYNFRINELTVGTVAQSTGKVIGKVVWIGRITASAKVYVGVEMNPPIEGCTAGVLGGAKVYEARRPNIYFEELQLWSPYRTFSRAAINQTDHVKSRSACAEKRIPDVSHDFPDRSHWDIEKTRLKGCSIEVDARRYADTPFYQYSEESGFISYNIEDYIIHALYRGLPAQTDDGINGSVTWMGRHWSYPDSIYVGVEMANPTAECTDGKLPVFGVKVYDSLTPNIYFKKLKYWKPYTITSNDNRPPQASSSETRRQSARSRSDKQTHSSSSIDIGRRPTGIRRPTRNIKVRDITDVDDSPYYHWEGKYDVYHIDKFVIEGVAYGDKRFGYGFPGTIVCMVRRRSDDFDISSIYVGVKLDMPDEQTCEKSRPEGLHLIGVRLSDVLFCPLSHLVAIEEEREADTASKSDKYPRSTDVVRDDLFGQKDGAKGLIKINMDSRDDTIHTIENYYKEVSMKQAPIIMDDINSIYSQNIVPSKNESMQEKPIRRAYHSPQCRTGGCEQCNKDDLLFWVAPEQRKDGSWITDVVPPKQFRRADFPLTKRDVVPVEDKVPDYVPSPSDCQQYRGVWKGVQGDQNSCYMDASMFAMFSYLSVFDDLMLPEKSSHKDQSPEAMQLRLDIKEVMKDKIVNRLRKYGLTQHDGMHQLRGYLDSMGLVQGLTGEEKDPEEFLNLILVDTFQTPPPIVLSNGQESHLLHILADKEEKMVFPTVQELLERTCLQEGFRFSKIPPYLIMHLPRFGKGYKMYPKVFPSLELDMTGVMEGARQNCIVCDEEASYECYDCYKAADDNQMEAAMFCKEDVDKYHSKKQRGSHKQRRIKPTASPSVGAARMMPEAKAQMPEDKQKLRLAAALCKETSHYVTYVSTGKEPNAPWQFFDSMADREETTNIPEVKNITDIRRKLMECREDITTADPIVRRLVKDAYICIYVNPDADRRPDGVKIHEEPGMGPLCKPSFGLSCYLNP